MSASAQGQEHTQLQQLREAHEASWKLVQQRGQILFLLWTSCLPAKRMNGLGLDEALPILKGESRPSLRADHATKVYSQCTALYQSYMDHAELIRPFEEVFLETTGGHCEYAGESASCYHMLAGAYANHLLNKLDILCYPFREELGEPMERLDFWSIAPHEAGGRYLQLIPLEELSPLCDAEDAMWKFGLEARLQAEYLRARRLVRLYGLEPSELVSQAPMRPGERAIWEILNGRAMTGPQLAEALQTSPQSVRVQINSMNRVSPRIEHKPGIGYFRPDAPPKP